MLINPFLPFILGGLPRSAFIGILKGLIFKDLDKTSLIYPLEKINSSFLGLKISLAKDSSFFEIGFRELFLGTNHKFKKDLDFKVRKNNK